MALEFISKEYGKAGTNNPTILFLDIIMPTLNGWDFLDEFKNFSDSIQHQITIFIVSSSVRKQDKEKVAKYKFVSGFISKPITKDNLKQLFD
jgi:CheY-like chemotaxis protein